MSAYRGGTIRVTCPHCSGEHEVQVDADELDVYIVTPCDSCGENVQVFVEVEVSKG